jgi:hypothetical protein
MLGLLGGGYATEGHPVPANDRISATSDPSFDIGDGQMVPMQRKPGRRALLDGNFARRKLPLRETEYCIWDTELAGFGCASGQAATTIGSCVSGIVGSIAGSLWADPMTWRPSLRGRRRGGCSPRWRWMVCLKRTVVKATPIMSDFVDTYWDDLSRVWKASTISRNFHAWKRNCARV